MLTWSANSGSLLHAADGGRRVRTVDDIRAPLRSGPTISINSRGQPSRIRQGGGRKIGRDHIVVAIDAKRVKRGGGGERWEIFTHGGRSTGIDAYRIRL
jgi:cyclase